MSIKKHLTICVVIILVASIFYVATGFLENEEEFENSGEEPGEDSDEADYPWLNYERERRNTGLSPHNTSHIEGFKSWSFEAESDFRSSPAVDENGTIYAGTWDGELYALNPEGEKLWSFEAGDSIYSTPTFDDNGTIYFGSHDENLYAVDAEGNEKWSLALDNRIYSSPTVGEDGTIYVGSGYFPKYSDFGFLHAINPNGTERWTFETDGPVYSSPAIGENNTKYVGTHNGTLYAISNGTEKWSYQTDHRIESSPAISEEGTIYVGSLDDSLYALNPNGTKRWSFQANNSIYTSPAICEEGIIYFGTGSRENNFFALYPNGTEKWKTYIRGGIYRSWSSPVSPVISNDGNIYSSGIKLYSLNQNGTERWTFPLRDGSDTSPTIGEDGTIYMTAQENKLYALGPREENYTLTIQTEGGGNTEPELGEHEYSPGSEITVEAIPDEGCDFRSWGGDLPLFTEVGEEITIEMRRNIHLVADFSILQEGEYIGTDEEWYEPGENVLVEVKNDCSAINYPIINDFRIYIENVGTGEVVHDPGTGFLQPLVPDYGHTESFVWNQTDPNNEQVDEGVYRVKGEKRFNHIAEFVISEEPPDTELSIDKEGEGRIIPGTGTSKYREGMGVTVEATPEDGWYFTGWTGDEESSNREITLTMDENITLTANFEELEEDERVLTIWIDGEGSTYPEEGDTIYDEGEEVTIEATPDANWKFEKWTGDFEIEEEEISVEMEENKSLTAHFEVEKYTLKIDALREGEVQIEPEKEEYEHGEEVTLTAVPDQGYEFVEWEGKDETGDEITVTMDEDKEVTAHFQVKTYELTVDTVGEGSVDIEPDKAEYEHGEEVTLTAVPDEGHELVEWESTDETGEEITITMDEDKEIAAVFEEEDDDDIPGFTSTLLLLAAVMAVAIYQKKKH